MGVPDARRRTYRSRGGRPRRRRALALRRHREQGPRRAAPPDSAPVRPIPRRLCAGRRFCASARRSTVSPRKPGRGAALAPRRAGRQAAKGFWALRALAFMGYYGQPEVWPSLRYTPSSDGNEMLHGLSRTLRRRDRRLRRRRRHRGPGAGAARAAQGKRVAGARAGAALRDDGIHRARARDGGALYADGGGFLTADGTMTLAFGRGYGGSTIVYTGTSLIAPRAGASRAGTCPGSTTPTCDRRSRKYMGENNVHLLAAGAASTTTTGSSSTACRRPATAPSSSR